MKITVILIIAFFCTLIVLQSGDLKDPNLVWPEQLPFGDRIRTQMDYVPKGYEYEKSPMIRILYYNGLSYIADYHRKGPVEFYGCPVSQCMLTDEKSLGSKVEAVIFHHDYHTPNWKRPSYQVSKLSENY